MQAPETSQLHFLLKDDKAQCEARALPHGVVLFKNCLDIEEQISLVRTCLKLADEEVNRTLLPRTKYTATSKKAVPLLFYNWPAVPGSITGMKEPTELLRFGKRMFKQAYKNGKKSGANMLCPRKYDPNALYAVLYPHGGSFIPHVDGAKGWALSVSVGNSANFFYSDGKEGERTYVRLDSGDALIFNGGQLYHGVECIYPNTAPAFWTSDETEISKYDMSRLVLQFRDPCRDASGLKYYPHFYAIGE
jgi:alkylated DNA repair dioxygenase AlkB